MTCFTASPDGVPLAFDVHGALEPAVALIHGWSCDRSYWAAQVEPLAGEFRLITLDLGGHGESGTGRSCWTVESFGRDVAAVVEAVGPRQVMLVGHSMGGTVAVAAAHLLGKRVSGLVLVDSYRRFGSPRSPQEIEQILGPFRRNFKEATDSYVRGMFPANADEVLVQRVAGGMAEAPADIAVPALESSMTYGRTITEAVEGIETPITALNADLPPNDPESMRRHGVDVRIMAGVGHFPMMEQPAEFTALLRQTLREMCALRR